MIEGKRGGKTTYGLRAEAERFGCCQEVFQMETRESCVIGGLPPAIDQEDLRKIVHQMSWSTEVVPNGKRFVKGASTWDVLAAPPSHSWPLKKGTQRCTLRVASMRNKDRVHA